MSVCHSSCNVQWRLKLKRVVKVYSFRANFLPLFQLFLSNFHEARAKIIAAEGEKKASQSLKEASDVISQSGAALQLRYLQTLNNIAQEKNSTIIFPIPVEIMRGFFGGTD